MHECTSVFVLAVGSFLTVSYSIEFRLLGLCSKYLYSLSHLAGLTSKHL